MTPKNQVIKTVNKSLLGKQMLLGAITGLFLIGLFLMGTGEPNPAWGKFWIIKPLFMVPLAGAFGGGVFYFINFQFSRLGWNKVAAAILGLIAFLIILWLGTVLGLNGTYWD